MQGITKLSDFTGSYLPDGDFLADRIWYCEKHIVTSVYERETDARDANAKCVYCGGPVWSDESAVTGEVPTGPKSSRGEEIHIGDYVIADHAQDDDWTGDTFVVTGFDVNPFGAQLILVRAIGRRGSRMAFYPSELSHENWA